MNYIMCVDSGAFSVYGELLKKGYCKGMDRIYLLLLSVYDWTSVFCVYSKHTLDNYLHYV